jgi:2-dehydrotetronate isomerase
MPQFSANLGFMWRELGLPDAIRAAKRSGFDAVESHIPYDVPIEDVRAALAETGMVMVGINTRQGINGAADFGVNAMPARGAEARGYIDEAVAYGAAIGCLNINALAGKTGRTDEAEATYRANLAYACEKAARHGMIVVVEPINQRDAPRYHVSLVEQAVETIQAVGAPNLRLMFDCYHTQIMQGDLIRRLEWALPWLGHIQFAGVPLRQEPDEGEVDYGHVFAAIDAIGWRGYVGAEYRPRASTEAGLGWLAAWSKRGGMSSEREPR